MRLQKFLSNSGIASRRAAEKLIERGSVRVNGKRASIGDMVDSEDDIVTVNGKYVDPPAELFYIMMNKPASYVTTRQDPHAKKTVFDLLPRQYKQKVWPVGRLDADTEGLLLFTNDGDLTQLLTHPGYEHEKEYEVTLATKPTAKQLRDLRQGTRVRGSTTAPARAVLRQQTLFLTITEGKNHQVKLMCRDVGLDVRKLKRVRIQKYRLQKNMKPGDFYFVKKSAII